MLCVKHGRSAKNRSNLVASYIILNQQNCLKINIYNINIHNLIQKLDFWFTIEKTGCNTKNIPLYKWKDDKGNCTNYIAISLLSTTAKISIKILVGKVMEIIEEKIWKVQCGFMPGRSYADQIFSLW